jgi:hypothetical protein
VCCYVLKLPPPATSLLRQNYTTLVVLSIVLRAASKGHLRFTPLFRYSRLLDYDFRRIRTVDQSIKHAPLSLQGHKPCVHAFRQFLRIKVSVPSATRHVYGDKRAYVALSYRARRARAPRGLVHQHQHAHHHKDEAIVSATKAIIARCFVVTTP